jgi:hypothetical protein
MRFFLAGIMQGSHLGEALHNQSYRVRIKRSLAAHFPRCQVYDPLADHQDSLTYDDDKARRVFLAHNKLCAEMDVLLAFVPEASMGTAIEMWEAYRHGAVVIAISPLVHNWAIKFCSDHIYPDLESFESGLQSGHVQQLISQKA